MIIQKVAFCTIVGNRSCEYYLLYVFDEWLLMENNVDLCCNGKQSRISVITLLSYHGDVLVTQKSCTGS